MCQWPFYSCLWPVEILWLPQSSPNMVCSEHPHCCCVSRYGLTHASWWQGAFRSSERPLKIEISSRPPQSCPPERPLKIALRFFAKAFLLKFTLRFSLAHSARSLRPPSFWSTYNSTETAYDSTGTAYDSTGTACGSTGTAGRLSMCVCRQLKPGSPVGGDCGQSLARFVMKQRWWLCMQKN